MGSDDSITSGLLHRIEEGWFIGEIADSAFDYQVALEKGDQAAVDEAIARMVEDAEADRNTVPAMLDAVRAEATLGEICNAFRPIWGDYREPVRF